MIQICCLSSLLHHGQLWSFPITVGGNGVSFATETKAGAQWKLYKESENKINSYHQ